MILKPLKKLQKYHSEEVINEKVTKNEVFYFFYWMQRPKLLFVIFLELFSMDWN